MASWTAAAALSDVKNETVSVNNSSDRNTKSSTNYHLEDIN